MFRIPLLRASTNTLFMFTAIFGTIASTPAYSAAPMVKTSPGYYRMMLGDFEITALSDGTFNQPSLDSLLLDIKPEKITEALANEHIAKPVETSVNAYLINTGAKLILVDTGAARLFVPSVGKLLARIKAAGYKPEQVDEVYITHMHFDHIGGLMDGDKIAFPNAIVRADKREADYWLSQANLANAPDALKGFFQAAIATFNPYINTGRFLPFYGDTDLVAGVKAMANYGHTPGHTIYVIESKGQKLVLWGDLMHVAAVQFPNPEIAIQFDTDIKNAVAQRNKIFSDAAEEGYLVAGAHVSFPGIGHLRAKGKGYVWIPVNYSEIP